MKVIQQVKGTQSDGTSVTVNIEKTTGQIQKFRCVKCHQFCFEQVDNAGNCMWFCSACGAKYPKPKRMT